MHIEKMNDLPMQANGKRMNAFIDDFSNIGQHMGTNCIIMYPNNPHEKMKYLIVINTETGEKIKVIVDTEDAMTHTQTVDFDKDILGEEQIFDIPTETE